jgi:carboxyl-terminal processing protease
VKKVLIYVSITVIALVLLSGAFSGGFLAGHYFPAGNTAFPALDLPPVSVPQGNDTPANQGTPTAPQDIQTLFAPFWETWQIIHDQYVDQPVDDVALMRGAIRGMLASLGDEHTSYMDRCL